MAYWDAAFMTTPADVDTIDGGAAKIRELKAATEKGGNIILGSDADGDTYYRASGVLARLAKGAANLKTFMNAGATAPEWASGISATAHTRDLATASGNQTLTGAGFLPSAAICFFGIDPISSGVGFKSTTQVTLILAYNSALSALIAQQFINVSITAANNYYCNITFNSDGGVLAWVKTGLPTGTLDFAVIWLR